MAFQGIEFEPAELIWGSTCWLSGFQVVLHLRKEAIAACHGDINAATTSWQSRQDDVSTLQNEEEWRASILDTSSEC